MGYETGVLWDLWIALIAKVEKHTSETHFTKSATHFTKCLWVHDWNLIISLKSALFKSHLNIPGLWTCVSEADYIIRILWNVIIYPCPGYQLQAHNPSILHCLPPNRSLDVACSSLMLVLQSNSQQKRYIRWYYMTMTKKPGKALHYRLFVMGIHRFRLISCAKGH